MINALIDRGFINEDYKEIAKVETQDIIGSNE